MDFTEYKAGVFTTDTFEIWRQKTNGIIIKVSTGFLGENPDTGYPTWNTDGDILIGGTAGTATNNSLTSNDIFCRNIFSGRGISTGDSVIELGTSRTANGKAIVDFHTSVGSDFDARIKKEGTLNGLFSFENKGTGNFLFDQLETTASFIFSHAQNERLRIQTSGVTVGTTGQPIPLTVEGNIITTKQFKNNKVTIDGSDIYEHATNAPTTLSINRIGNNNNFRTTAIYDGKGSELAIFAGSDRSITIGNDSATASLKVIGAAEFQSLTTKTGAITGGAVTCASLSAGTGNITCGNLTTSGNITSSAAITGASLSAGTGNITCGNLTSSVGVISGVKITSSGEIYGKTLQTDSKLTFTASGNGSSDQVTIERINPSVDVSHLRITIGDNPDGAAVDSFIIGIDSTTGWLEKFRVTSAGDVTAAGSVKANGDIVAYNSSDLRLKENVKVISNALLKVSQLNGVTFDWNDQQTLYSGNDVGVIAQEVEAVLPQIVTTRENGYKAVKYERLVALLIESVKELKVNNEQLQARIYNLENQINI